LKLTILYRNSYTSKELRNDIRWLHKEELNLNQTELGQQLIPTYSLSTVSNWLNGKIEGKATPRMRNWARLVYKNAVENQNIELADKIMNRASLKHFANTPLEDTRSTKKRKKPEKSTHVSVPPFWNARSQLWSQMLWPVGAKGQVELESPLFPDHRHHWYAANILTPKNQNTTTTTTTQSPALIADTILESLVKDKRHNAAPSEPELKTAIYRVYPNKKQRTRADEWLSTACIWTYNRSLDFIKKRIKELIANKEIEKEGDIESRHLPEPGELLKYCVNRNSTLLQQEYTDKHGNKGINADWVTNTPSGVRQAAMMDVLKAYNSCIAKVLLN
jgi:hypothetical protein